MNKLDSLFSLYCQGKIMKSNDLFEACDKDPYLYGALMKKILDYKQNGSTSEVSGGSNATAEASSSEVDSKEQGTIQEVRPRSRQTICEQGEDPKKQPRERVRKTVRFQNNGFKKAKSLVPRYGCPWYSGQGLRCICIVWEQTKRFLSSMGIF